MKKVLVVVLVFIFTLGLCGCAKQEYELPWDHFCYSADDGSVIELSPEEKGYIMDVLNNGEWYGEIAKCTQDVIFATKQQSIGYCISQGIFNDFTQSKSLRLSNADRKIVNGYLVKPATRLIEIEEYATLTIDGTTSIEVVYDYIKGEFTTYEFVIDDSEVIDNIMAEVFNMELKMYPENADIEFYQRWITVKQDDREYRIYLGYAFDDYYGYNYLCQSQAVHEIIENYIENNLLLPSGNVACVDVSSLPEGRNYSFSGEAAKAIVDYLSNLTLISDFSENPNEYGGMTWVISLEYDNNDDLTVYHFGNMFIRFGSGPWYKMVPEQARQFDILLDELND